MREEIRRISKKVVIITIVITKGKVPKVHTGPITMSLVTARIRLKKVKAMVTRILIPKVLFPLVVSVSDRHYPMQHQGMLRQHPVVHLHLHQDNQWLWMVGHTTYQIPILNIMLVIMK